MLKQARRSIEQTESDEQSTGRFRFSRTLAPVTAIGLVALSALVWSFGSAATARKKPNVDLRSGDQPLDATRRTGKALGWDSLPMNCPGPAIAPVSLAEMRDLQFRWAEYLGIKVHQNLRLSDKCEIEMTLIPPGEFDMGTDVEAQENLVQELNPLRGEENFLRTEGPRSSRSNHQAFLDWPIRGQR